MRNRGGSCYTPSKRPYETVIPRGARYGDYKIERTLGARFDLFEARCTRCQALTSFSFATLRGTETLLCTCRKTSTKEIAPP